MTFTTRMATVGIAGSIGMVFTSAVYAVQRVRTENDPDDRYSRK